MRLSLFAKIFASFWLTTLLIAVAVAWSTWHLVAAHRGDEMRERIERSGAALATASSALLAASGRESLEAWLAALNAGRVGGGPLLLLDESGRPQPGSAPLPPAARGADLATLREQHGVRTFALPGPETATLWLGIAPRAPRAAPPSLLRGPPGHERLRLEIGLARLGITVLVGGFVCWLLARHLTRPIRELQAASARLARGDFAIGIAARTLTRRDELAALARDFDAMAAKLGRLLDAQRQLLRDVSHELRSPLARLQIAAALARRKGGSTVEAEVERIETETARLDELVGQLLTLMRLETNGAEVPVTPLDLSTLLAGVARDAEFEATARGVTVETDIGAGLRVQGSGDLLRSAVENVVRNALRHTPCGSRVRLAAARAGDAIRVRVRDQGPGVPAALLERIFEPFVRADEAREQSAGGTGLGLAIARRAAVAHGGDIAARNLADGGFEVELRLPAATPAEAA